MGVVSMTEVEEETVEEVVMGVWEWKIVLVLKRWRQRRW